MLGPRSRRELDALGRARCGARKMPQGPEPLCCEERPGELGLLSLEQRRLRGIPAVAGSTCREAPRGRSRALPGGAQRGPEPGRLPLPPSSTSVPGGCRSPGPGCPERGWGLLPAQLQQRLPVGLGAGSGGCWSTPGTRGTRGALTTSAVL